MKTHLKNSDQKETRFSIRGKLYQKNTIERAAKLCKTNLSSFMLENAYKNAQSILAEQKHFVLPDKQWKEFCVALDRPPKTNIALKKLLSEPDFFDLQQPKKIKE